MLSGNKFPQNIRALRILTEEILRPHIGWVQSFPELMDARPLSLWESYNKVICRQLDQTMLCDHSICPRRAGRWLAITSVGSRANDAILLCSRTFQLRSVRPLLSPVHAASPSRRPSEIHGRKIYGQCLMVDFWIGSGKLGLNFT